jgi:hypothetical protein
MISVELARQLRSAGLPWRPAERDVFAIPDGPLDGQVFILSQFTALLQLYRGEPIVAFHGSSEWAIDHVFVAETVWLPTETQLREMIEARLGADAPLGLERIAGGYRCHMRARGAALQFDAPTAEDAYGLALLSLLRASGEGAGEPR